MNPSATPIVQTGFGAVVGGAALAAAVVSFKFFATQAKELSTKNQEQFQKLCRIWELKIGPGVRVPKEMEPSNPGEVGDALQCRTIELSYWTDSFEGVNGIFMETGKDLIRTICLYIGNAKPRQNWFQSQYSLPRHFFLHEVLTWLTKCVCAYEGNDEQELNALRARLNYFLEVEKVDVFDIDPGLLGQYEKELTIRQVLAKLIRTLSNEIIPKMEAKLSVRSAAKRLEALCRSLSSTLPHNVLQTFHQLLSDQKPRILLREDWEAVKSDVKRDMTICALLLRQLARHPNLEIGSDFTNPFFSGGELCVPSAALLQTKLIYSQSSSNFAKILGSSNGGLFRELKRLPKFETLALQFVLAHALAWECMSSSVVLDAAKKLADEGGNIFVYGIQQKKILEVMESVIILLLGLERACKSIYSILFEYYMSRIDEQKKPESWDHNFRRSPLPKFILELQEMVSKCLDIHADCTKLSWEERVEQARKDLVDFGTKTETHLENVTRLIERRYLHSKPNFEGLEAGAVLGLSRHSGLNILLPYPGENIGDRESEQSGGGEEKPGMPSVSRVVKRSHSARLSRLSVRTQGQNLSEQPSGWDDRATSVSPGVMMKGVLSSLVSKRKARVGENAKKDSLLVSARSLQQGNDAESSMDNEGEESKSDEEGSQKAEKPKRVSLKRFFQGSKIADAAPSATSPASAKGKEELDEEPSAVSAEAPATDPPILSKMVVDHLVGVCKLHERSEEGCHGCSPLITVARVGCPESLKRLLDLNKNNKPSDLCDVRSVAVRYAAMNGHVGCLRLLIVDLEKDRSKLSEPCENGYTPLHLAAWNGHAVCVKLLIDSLGSECLCPKDKNGSTPLHFACKAGRLGCVKLLVDALKSKPHQLSLSTNLGFTPLHVTVEKGHTDCAELLLRALESHQRSPITNLSLTPLHVAAQNGHDKCVQLLLDFGAKPVTLIEDQSQSTPLHRAAFSGSARCVELLINALGSGSQQLSRYNRQGYMPVHVAASEGHTDCVKLLYRALESHQQSPITKCGLTPLNIAAQNGHNKCVKFLCEFGDSIAPLHHTK